MVQSRHTPPKQKDKKRTPPGIIGEPVELFEELPIHIKVKGGTGFIAFMRLLTIKDINILNRIIYMQERDPNSEQAAVMLISLAASTLDIPSNEIPVEASSGLVQHMIKFNFPNKGDKSKDGKGKPPEKSASKKDGLIQCIDFLIANGHAYSDIMNYPVKVFDSFIVITAERLGIKQKPTDPAAAFRQLGLNVKPRGAKK